MSFEGMSFEGVCFAGKVVALAAVALPVDCGLSTGNIVMTRALTLEDL